MLLIQAEKVNMADYGYMHATLYTKKELADVVKLYETKPIYLFVDKRILRNNTTDYVVYPGDLGESTIVEIFTKIRHRYRFVEDIGMLYVYKRI